MLQNILGTNLSQGDSPEFITYNRILVIYYNKHFTCLYYVHYTAVIYGFCYSTTTEDIWDSFKYQFKSMQFLPTKNVEDMQAPSNVINILTCLNQLVYVSEWSEILQL